MSIHGPREAGDDASRPPGAGRQGWPLGRILLAFLALAALFLLSIGVGRYPMSLPDALRILAFHVMGWERALPAELGTVVIQIRLPRVLAAMLVGAGLAAAGATYQSVFRNPLVSPSILGVSAGAGLGASLGIFLSLPIIAVQSMAFAAGLLTVLLVYWVTRLVGGSHNPLHVLVLAGVVIGSLMGAGVSLLKYLADPYDELPAITFWLLGSLASIDLADLGTLAPALAIGLLPLVLLRWRINLMSLGDEEARSLGVSTGRMRMVLIAAATLMTAAAVSVSGTIGWVGLVIPHLARILVGPNFERLLPTAVLLGAGYLLMVDTLARVLTQLELPLGAVTAVVGAPFFLWLLARSRQGWQ